MKDKIILWIIITITVLSSVSAFEYFTYRMNFPLSESREHIQEITFKGNLTITIPSGFSFDSSTSAYTASGSNYTWISANKTTINYTISSPNSCTENTVYKSQLYNNGTFIDEFIYVCIPDSKVVDYKIEYGHGCANYLSDNELYISNETATLFNLLRVWNIGSFLEPDEDIHDANAVCYYEKYPVRTYGRVDVDYETDKITGTFHWDYITGGYWFRIGVLSQDVSGKSVGEFYDVNCTELSYDFEHQRVTSPFQNYSVEIRSIQPLARNSAVQGSKEVVTIQNIEKYAIYNLVLDFIVDGYVETNYVPKLAPGETLVYYADPGTNATVNFVPSWYKNCFTPVYYQQILSNTTNVSINNPPEYNQIPSQAWLENTNNSNVFDLDDYFSDPENNTLTYSYNGTENITVTIDGNNEVSFSPDANWTGIEYVVFSADDGTSTTYSNNITLVVYPFNATVIQNVTNVTVVKSGGGSKTRYVYVPAEEEDEECREIWLCDEWSQCSPEGIRRRTCEDINNCSTEKYKPDEIENCIYGGGNLTSGDSMGVGRPEEEKPMDTGREGVEEDSEDKDICRPCRSIPLIIAILMIILIVFLLFPEREEKSKLKKPKRRR